MYTFIVSTLMYGFLIVSLQSQFQHVRICLSSVLAFCFFWYGIATIIIANIHKIQQATSQTTQSDNLIFELFSSHFPNQSSSTKWWGVGGEQKKKKRWLAPTPPKVFVQNSILYSLFQVFHIPQIHGAVQILHRLQPFVFSCLGEWGQVPNI